MKQLCFAFAALLVFACDDTASPTQEQEATDAGGTADGGRDVSDTGGGAGGGGGECTPTGDEQCNGLDDNCDGHIDEGFGIGAPCAAGMGICATDGKIACASDGSGPTCDATPGAPDEDVCDGVDNDCDGQADEDFDLDTDPDHCGQCDRACSYAHAAGVCNLRECLMGDCEAGFGDANGLPTDGCECEVQSGGVEACNGVDDDCDGEIDDGFATGDECSAGEGRCAATGVVECGADGAARCSATPLPPGDEICNGIDDDCDGDIDEGFDADEDGARLCPDLDCDAPCPAGFDCEVACGQRDCDDNDPTRHPAARDPCEDGIDQNCDGRDPVCQAPIGRANAAQIAGVQAGCGDFDGDNRPDNAFAGIGGLANQQLQTSIDDQSINIMFATMGLAPPGRDGRFDLAILTGIPSGLPNVYDLDPQSVDDNGDPLILYANVNVVGGAMRAGPGDFGLSVPVPGGPIIDIEVSETTISGTLSVDAQGVTLINGMIAGLVTDDALQAALVAVPAEVAVLLPILLQPDIDTDADGADDAYSVCLTFSAVPSTLRGFPVP